MEDRGPEGHGHSYRKRVNTKTAISNSSWTNPLRSKINKCKPCHESRNRSTLTLFCNIPLDAWLRDILTVDFVYIALNFSLSEQLLINIPFSFRVICLKMRKHHQISSGLQDRRHTFAFLPHQNRTKGKEGRSLKFLKKNKTESCMTVTENIKSRSTC